MILVLVFANPTAGNDRQVKVLDLEFSYTIQLFCILSCMAI